MNNICVVQAPFYKDECDSNITLGFGSLTAGLKDKGIKTDQIDLNYYIKSGIYGLEERSFDENLLRDFNLNKNYILGKNSKIEKELEQLIRESELSSYQAVFFTLSSSNQYFPILSISKKLKKMNPDTLIILGGSFLNKTGGDKDLYPLNFPFIDFIYRGFIEPVDIKPGFTAEDIKDTRGFCYKNSSGMVVKEFVDVKPENEVKPYYAKHIVEQSKNLSTGNSFVMLYRISRRCNNGCSFCNFKQGYKNKSLSKVKRDIKELKKEYKTSKFLLCDSNIAFDIDYLEKFSEKAGEIGIQWGGNSQFIRKDESFYRKLSDNGCSFFFHGLESGSNKVLESMGKPLDRNTAEKSIRKEFRTGIKSVNHVIVGFPEETSRDFRKTYSFLSKNSKFIYDILVHKFDLVDGIDIFQNSQDYGVQKKEGKNAYKNQENIDDKEFLEKYIGLKSVPYTQADKDFEGLKKIKKRRHDILYYRFKLLLAAKKLVNQNEINTFDILFKKPYLKFGNDFEDLFI